MGDTADEGSPSAGGAEGASAGGAAASAAEWEEVAAEWLDKAVSGAAAMYTDAIFKIPELGLQVGHIAYVL